MAFMNEQLLYDNQELREKLEDYSAALQKIVDTAPANGEDVSYLIAKQALGERE